MTSASATGTSRSATVATRATLLVGTDASRSVASRGASAAVASGAAARRDARASTAATAASDILSRVRGSAGKGERASQSSALARK